MVDKTQGDGGEQGSHPLTCIQAYWALSYTQEAWTRVHMLITIRAQLPNAFRDSPNAVF
jgi:hypothetical protein